MVIRELSTQPRNWDG